MHHKSTIVIYAANKQELYKDFCKEAIRVYPDDPSKRVSKEYFLRLLREDRPNIRVRVGGEFMKCDICVTLKEKRHGAPGVKPMNDSTVLESIDKKLSDHRQVGVQC
ncbi:unnamed protein product [Choristocarpus tenellus]